MSRVGLIILTLAIGSANGHYKSARGRGVSDRTLEITT